MPEISCPDCDRTIAMHELETNTVARRTGFDTEFRCPFCDGSIDEVAELLA